MLPDPNREKRILEVVPIARSIAWKYVRKIGSSHIEQADLEQEAMAAVCRVVDTWSPDGGSTWASYAYVRANGAIQDYLRRAQFGGRWHWKEYTVKSINAPVLTDGVDEIVLGDTIAADDRPLYDRPDPHLPERLEEALGRLPLDEQSAIELRWGMTELSLVAIGEAMGISESRACQLLTSAKNHLAEAHLRENLGVEPA